MVGAKNQAQQIMRWSNQMISPRHSTEIEVSCKTYQKIRISCFNMSCALDMFFVRWNADFYLHVHSFWLRLNNLLWWDRGPWWLLLGLWTYHQQWISLLSIWLSPGVSMHFSILSLSGHSSPWQNLQNLIDLVLSPRPVNLQGKNHIRAKMIWDISRVIYVCKKNRNIQKQMFWRKARSADSSL